MLRRVLDVHGGALPAHVHALFCNTGKEREETLEFVREISEQWHVPIVWLEYEQPAGVREVSFATASRRGEPFDAVIAHRSAINPRHDWTLPNPVSPWCSSELKQRTMRRWMLARGYEEWDSIVGLRADEPRRVARMRDRRLEGGWIMLPLADARIGKHHVREFWDRQPFGLKLRDYEGNCDLCFKKSLRKLATLCTERPGIEAWWAAHERDGARWRADRPGYAALADYARRQVRLPIAIDDDDIPCLCTE
jgi:hypothetical protein